jgi:putative ABC transport system substrate-binding protein
MKGAVMKRILAIAVGMNPDKGSREVFRNIIGGSQEVPVRPYVIGLIDGLKVLGLAPGRDFQIDYATCEPKGFSQFVKATLGQTNPDAMFAMSTTAVKAAMAASKTVSVVFPSISDPIEDGIVKSCAAPGKNATGIQAMRRQTADECLELFKATVPSLRRIFGLHKPRYDPATRAYKNVRLAARRAGVTFTPLTAKSHTEIVSILSAMSPKVGKNGPEDGVLVMPDDLALSAWPKIAAICRDRKIPNFFPVTDWVKDAAPSALAGFGIPQYACGEAAAAYMHKILNGVPAQSLPVKRAGGFEWAVNNTLAKAMGITIPASVLSAADRVI